MNAKTKKRLGVVTGLIVIIVIVVLAVVGGNSAAKTVSVADAIGLKGDNKIQVTGNVVENSFDIRGDVLTFKIYDAEADPLAASQLDVRYDGGVAATFGNDVTAICTGKKGADGVLNCSELVTKCPSKYANAEGSLKVSELLSYGDKVLNKPVLVNGAIGDAGVSTVDAAERFVLLDPESGQELPVRFSGALPDGMIAGAQVVLTGSIGQDGSFNATSAAFKA